jgi:hypothetical protein
LPRSVASSNSLEGMDVPNEYLAVCDHVSELIVTHVKKAKLLQRNKDEFHLEAELPSCCACGVHSFPKASGLHKSLSEAQVDESCDVNETFCKVQISNPILDELAVTDEQLVDHAATRDLQSVFTYQGVDYHLHPHLVLPGKVERERIQSS